MNLSARSSTASTRDHFFAVPLDYADPDGEKITLYAREVISRTYQREPGYLLFLQGGPGIEADRPVRIDGWLGAALQEYKVILLDQRGTGRSTPANRQTLVLRGDSERQAKYLSHFRADSIVKDAEYIRHLIAGPGEPWSILGQSYGGFCAVTYLSYASEGLKEAYISGGLPALDAEALDVYKAAYPRVERKNIGYYQAYPDDVRKVREVVEYIDSHHVVMPGGFPLTARGFQSLGRDLGYPGSFEALHYLLEEAFVQGASGVELSDRFLEQARARISFINNPLYAVMHEPIYAQGSKTDWAAERALREFPQFSHENALDGDCPVLFTGEMIYPWMFEQDPALRPLRDTAEILAGYTDWPFLYEPERLAVNEVPVAASIYQEDMYVDRGYSEQTAETIRGANVWITDQYDHQGLRESDGVVMKKLIEMLRPGHQLLSKTANVINGLRVLGS
jgi:pimeloyl-ACP methyl ester carboxylesterase